MKSYTDLEQSKKLAEILPLESADMSWHKEFDSSMWLISLGKYTSWIDPRYSYNKIEDRILPCWSLAALMDVLDRGAVFKTSKGWACQTYIEYEAITSDYYNNPIDACVAMIEKLHEQKLLRL